MRSYTNLRILASLGLFAGALSGCPSTPYDGVGPEINEPSPNWENGNIGGALVLNLLEDRENPTDEEIESLINPRLVRITGDFSTCAPEEGHERLARDVRVVFGNRNAVVWASEDDFVEVLTPVGPIRGGDVDIRVACQYLDENGEFKDGSTLIEDAYDYYLGNLDEEGDRPDPEDRRRMEDLFDAEYGSFTMFYQDEPFASLPDAQGIGFFFSERSPRASMFWGQNPDLVYGGMTANQVEPHPVAAQVPQLNYEAPEQGDRLNGGDGFTFFFRRNYDDVLDPVPVAARKRISAQGFPEPHLDSSPNNIGVWLRFEIDGADGLPQERYLRVAQNVGNFCLDSSNPGCGESDSQDTRLNRTRIPIDNSFSLVFPDKPPREHFEENYPNVAPEYLAYLDCEADASCDEDAVGVLLPSGTYRDVQVIKAADEVGEWPWQGVEGRQVFRVIMEVVPEVEVTEGAQYVDFPRDVSTTWAFDADNSVYSNGNFTHGEGAFPTDRPIFISYPGGFSQGERIPPKNYDADQDIPWTYPEELPAPGSDEYDVTPWIEIPTVEIDTLLFASGTPFAQFGFPAQIPLEFEEGETPFDFRIPLPGGAANETEDMTGDEIDGEPAWADTYFIVQLEVRRIEGPGGFGGGPWKASAFAWAGDDFLVIPSETLQTMPTIANINKPDVETQEGSQYLGLASIEVHRLASWNLSTPEQLDTGVGFRSEDASLKFDINNISTGYFHTVNSCDDGIDNDGDGLIDAEDTNCARDPEAEFESGQCQDETDNDEDGLIDADDPDCLDNNGVYDENDTDEGSACSDGIDNDGDGWTDFSETDPQADPGCSSADDSTEGGFDPTIACNDGIDTDFDGLIDRDDPGCESSTDDSEEGDTCSDGIDNNGDGWIDGDDLRCRPGRNGTALAWTGGQFPNRGESEYTWIDAIDFQCSNSTAGGLEEQDDDGDGLINADDPECAYGWDPSGESALPGECADLIDNDGDGWFDYADPDGADDGSDPDCLTANHPEGGAIPGGSCNDGTDNDGDGWIDADDPICRTGAQNETATDTAGPYSGLECNNNVDDDGDGDVDADDADCVSGKDSSESE